MVTIRYTGRVKNGVIVLDQPVDVPDGTVARITVIEDAEPEKKAKDEQKEGDKTP